MNPIKLADGFAADIVVERGTIARSGEFLDLKRRVLVLTDREVPGMYADAVCQSCLYPVRVSVWPGEETNSFQNYDMLCRAMLDNDFNDRDCVVAVGGEKLISLGGFLAATYRGGMDFYAVPTTLRAQTGRGIFEKSYLNFYKSKNVLGIMKTPRRTLVDSSALDTLDERRMADGYAEIIRLALVLDRKLFEKLESWDMSTDKVIDQTIRRCMEIRKYIYGNVRAIPVLSSATEFGALIADSMEKTKFSYGERLAIGMLPFCSSEVRTRLRSVLTKFGLPVVWQYDSERLFRDSVGLFDIERIQIVKCDEIGTYKTDSVTIPEYLKMIKNVFGDK